MVYFKDVTQDIAPELKDLGLITDAMWMDIDNDEDKDLVIVGEWMPVTVFVNEQGYFKKANSENHGFVNTEGWWYAIDAGDFDKDGDQDIIVGNLGLNYKYTASTAEPFEVYASDFDDNEKMDIILAFHEEGEVYPLRGRECSSQQIPSIKEKFTSYDAFGKATILDIVGAEKKQKALNLKAKTFATTYFENNGDGTFKGKALPVLAQFSSVNDLLISDFNNDGNLDVTLAGNLYTSEVETPRNDASYGVFMAGNGQGDFKPYYPYQSGLYLDGDIKELAIINGNNRKYILAAKNNNMLQMIMINNK